MSDWDVVHEKLVEQFRNGWDRPDPHAWDSFIDQSMRFVQPMLRDGVGPLFLRRRLLRPVRTPAPAGGTR